MLVEELLQIREDILQSHFPFEEMALRIFRFQYEKVEVYRQWCNSLKVDAASVQRLSEIPFLPISLFKNHKVLAKGLSPVVTFQSSATTGQIPSQHLLDDISFYHQVSAGHFERAFGKLEGRVILALLPHYLERGNSSLVEMVRHFMELANQPASGFYLHDIAAFFQAIQEASDAGKSIIVFGVTYALLDAAEKHSFTFPDGVLVFETGGMKGRHKELLRAEVHEILKQQWNLPAIYSEYGMTELLSQAYTSGGEVFTPASTIKVLRRLPDDPLQVTTSAGKGAINVIDLANVHSCSFIATDDQGTLFADGTFTVSGRLDTAEIRGCNLMALPWQ